jgi:hypothetical protein
MKAAIDLGSYRIPYETKKPPAVSAADGVGVALFFFRSCHIASIPLEGIGCNLCNKSKSPAYGGALFISNAAAARLVWGWL